MSIAKQAFVCYTIVRKEVQSNVQVRTGKAKAYLQRHGFSPTLRKQTNKKGVEASSKKTVEAGTTAHGRNPHGGENA